MCNVIPVKCKRVSTHTLMFWAGLGNVIFSFLCVPLPKIDLVTLFHPYELGKYISNRNLLEGEEKRYTILIIYFVTIFISTFRGDLKGKVDTESKFCLTIKKNIFLGC